MIRSQVKGRAVLSFLTAVAIALKEIDRTRHLPDVPDPYRRVEAEIQSFCLVLQEHQNLTDDEWRDLEGMRDVLRRLYDDADFVMLDPSTQTPH